eukprot:PhF_6_TR27324/c0_g1_i1/m.40135/K20858/MCU; calcium uniporter protein, mitochondrial
MKRSFMRFVLCPPTTVQQLHNTAKYYNLRTHLRLLPEGTLPKEAFFKHCESVGLNTQESQECLQRFHKAGVVLVGGDDNNTVFLRPAQVVAACHTAMGLCATQSDAAVQLRTEYTALQTELETLQKQKTVLDAKMGKRRKFWWGVIAAYSGLQMYVMSRFTFIDFDWDIMEPVSFFFNNRNCAGILHLVFVEKRGAHVSAI